MSQGAIQLTTNAEQIFRRMHGLPRRVNVEIARSVARTFIVLRSDVRARAEVKARRGGAGMFGRVTSWARATSHGMEGAIGFRKYQNFPYELAHEFGANAHKGAMTVPLSPEAKAASGRGIGARDFGHKLFVFKTARRAFLAESIGRRVILHYVLIKSLPPRLHFRETILSSMNRISDAIINGFNAGKQLSEGA